MKKLGVNFILVAKFKGTNENFYRVGTHRIDNNGGSFADMIADLRQTKNLKYINISVTSIDGYEFNHVAFNRRYVSKADGVIIEPYKGRFGKGYVAFVPYSTRYSYKVYFTENEAK